MIIISSILLLCVVIYFSLAFYIGNKAQNDTKVKSDVIVVLGARSYLEGKYNPCLDARVVHAVKLYKTGLARKLLVTGGNDIEDGVNEAETMKKMAVERGVRAADVLMEKSATSTYENLVLSQKIMNKNRLKSAIIVTEPFHIARAALVAEKLKYNFTVSPAAENSCWLPNKYFTMYFLKEPFAIGVYKLQNKL